VDDLLNRFKTVQNGSTNIVDYTNMGVATPAIVKYPVPNLTLDYTATVMKYPILNSESENKLVVCQA